MGISGSRYCHGARYNHLLFFSSYKYVVSPEVQPCVRAKPTFLAQLKNDLGESTSTAQPKRDDLAVLITRARLLQARCRVKLDLLIYLFFWANAGRLILWMQHLPKRSTHYGNVLVASLWIPSGLLNRQLLSLDVYCRLSN